MSTAPEKQKATPGELVQLVGGPRCGDRIPWPSEKIVVAVPVPGGLADYEYEGDGKAIYPPMERINRKV